MRDYVTKYVETHAIWPIVYEDWVRINKAIIDRYGKANTEYTALLTQQK